MPSPDRVEVLFGQLMKRMKEIIREKRMARIIAELDGAGYVPVVNLQALAQQSSEPVAEPDEAAQDAEFLKSIGVAV